MNSELTNLTTELIRKIKKTEDANAVIKLIQGQLAGLQDAESQGNSAGTSAEVPPEEEAAPEAEPGTPAPNPVAAGNNASVDTSRRNIKESKKNIVSRYYY